MADSHDERQGENEGRSVSTKSNSHPVFTERKLQEIFVFSHILKNQQKNLELFENGVHIEGKSREACPLQANVQYLGRRQHHRCLRQKLFT